MAKAETSCLSGKDDGTITVAVGTKATISKKS